MRSNKSFWRKKPKPVWFLAAADILAAGIVLVVFAYFHHVRPTALPSEDIVIARPVSSAAPAATPVPTVSAAPEATATPEPTATLPPDPVGCFANKYHDKFTDGEIIQSEENGVYRYQSANLNISVSSTTVTTYTDVSSYDSTVYVTDIYVRDISCFTTAFAKDSYSKGEYEWLQSIAGRKGSVVAVNGDFFGARNNGVVIRNGTLYRSRHSVLDACVLYWDGTMKTFAPAEWDAEKLKKDGAYQAWNFGPMLLDKNGGAMTDFNSNVCTRNPRTAIGYYEPGHYCFVTVDGRSDTSRGLPMARLSEFMHDLGCTAAYNMDGGESSSLTWFDTVINNPADGGRKIQDAILIIDGEAVS